MLALIVGDSSIDSLLKIKMEEWSVETLDGNETSALRVTRSLLLGGSADVERVDSLNVLVKGLAVEPLGNGSRGSGTVATTELSDTEDGLVGTGTILVEASAITKASSGKSTLGPAILDVSKVPVDNLGSGKSVKLVANINQGLNGSDVHIVDGREVENDGLEHGTSVIGDLLDVSWFTIVPRTVLFNVSI